MRKKLEPWATAYQRNSSPIRRLDPRIIQGANHHAAGSFKAGHKGIAARFFYRGQPFSPQTEPVRGLLSSFEGVAPPSLEGNWIARRKRVVRLLTTSPHAGPKGFKPIHRTRPRSKNLIQFRSSRRRRGWEGSSTGLGPCTCIILFAPPSLKTGPFQLHSHLPPLCETAAQSNSFAAPIPPSRGKSSLSFR